MFTLHGVGEYVYTSSWRVVLATFVSVLSSLVALSRYRQKKVIDLSAQDSQVIEANTLMLDR